MSDKLIEGWNILSNKFILIFNIVLTAFLTAIGYPSQVINFILILIILDVLTRWYAEVVKRYGHFSIYNFLKAWKPKEKALSSKQLKKGLFEKIFFYGIFLFIAYQTSIIEQMTFGTIISNFLYSIMIILDSISIFENIVDSGYTSAKPILDFFKRKKTEITGTENNAENEVKIDNENIEA
jgi:hypothetical protein